jgi:hypothetical protein
MGASVSTHDAVTLEKAKELLDDLFRVRVDACFASSGCVSVDHGA